MACSKYEYVKQFEQDDALLRGCYIVVRVDGKAFSRFTEEHGYTKPNDPRGVFLMNAAATAVMRDWGDAILAYGQSDEYSFVFPPRTTVFGRRASKIATGIASLFAASFVFYWPTFFGPDTPLKYPPAFDARCVCYPTLAAVLDYCRWRHVDCYINAMYNETFWALVNRGGMSRPDAFNLLKGSLAADKHEILFTRFGLNFAKVPVIYRRGTAMVRPGGLAGAAAGGKASKGGKGKGRKDVSGGAGAVAGGDGSVGTARDEAAAEAAAVDGADARAAAAAAGVAASATSSSDDTSAAAPPPSPSPLPWCTDPGVPLPLTGSGPPLTLPVGLVWCYPDFITDKDFLPAVFEPHEK